ncbi:hypothetical protein PWG15_16680 [Ensifer adhaerens]|uniref:5'-methylthioadenosine/S-adenosylhomocysteine nucleosidase family protein n=1 Tax=Ensifer adhaerens TaxID=106592 RepID=UPI0023A9DEA7|nr:hypothetical protein [Ensifer adhaerens]WDZ76218.1 hypothetical protein PWG15_16680 [Ensifer adhaerens]
MKALIVHDRMEIAEQIADLIVECGSDRGDVVIAEDVRSASSELRQRMFDIAIIDLTLPYKKGRGSPSYEAVENMLVEIFETDTLHIPADLIGITKEPSAVQAVSKLIGSHVLAVIEEDDEANWKRELLDKLLYARRVAKARQESLNSQYDVDLCVITALDSELAVYSDRLTLVEADGLPGARKFMFTTSDGKPRKGVVFAVGRAGQASVASATQVLLSQYRPKLVVMSGICGGIKGKVKLGDVVVFQQVFDWDYGKWAIEKHEVKQPGVTDVEINNPDGTVTYGRRTFLARPTPLALDQVPVTSSCRALKNSGFKFPDEDLTVIKGLSKEEIGVPDIHYGPVASGSAVIADEFIMPRITSLNEDILAADMESYGFYYAAKNTNVVKPMFFCVKAVSDYCDHKKNDGIQKACNFVSSKIALHLSDTILTSQSQ